MEPITITDLTYLYSTLYTDCESKPRNCLQKTVTIDGVEGKQIQIDALSLSMSVAAAGVKGTATITAETGDGNETILAVWEETNTVYTPKSIEPAFLAEAGKPVILRWYLKTSSPVNRARMKLISYTYSLIDVVIEEPEPEPDEVECLISIICPSESAANNLLEALITSGYLENEAIKVYKKSI